MQVLKKVLVTGANGFLGNYIIHQLKNRNIETWAVVRNTNEDLTCFSDIDINVVYCDLNEMLSLPQQIKAREFDCFIHLAWAGSSGEEKAFYSLQLDNARACADAAQAAFELGCKRFVGIGSITEKMFVPYIQTDGSRPDMSSCYAVSKMAAHCLSKCICVDKGIEFVWGYVSNVYGIGDNSKNIINILIEQYYIGQSPVLTAGLQSADFIYVSDAAKAIIAIAERGRKFSSYYIGYGSPKPFKYYAQTIRNIVNPGVETGLGNREFKGQEINFEEIDIGKLYRDTGFVPDISFEEGIEKTFKWKRLLI